jgi:hypothetical protein
MGLLVSLGSLFFFVKLKPFLFWNCQEPAILGGVEHHGHISIIEYE